MAWSRRARTGAVGTAISTIILTALSLLWLWRASYGDPGVTPITFLKIGVVVAVIWAAIGATMAFFIVMVLRKNETLDRKG